MSTLANGDAVLLRSTEGEDEGAAGVNDGGGSGGSTSGEELVVATADGVRGADLVTAGRGEVGAGGRVVAVRDGVGDATAPVLGAAVGLSDGAASAGELRVGVGLSGRTSVATSRAVGCGRAPSYDVSSGSPTSATASNGSSGSRLTPARDVDRLARWRRTGETPVLSAAADPAMVGDASLAGVRAGRVG